MARGGHPAACLLTNGGNRCKLDEIVRNPRSTTGRGSVYRFAPGGDGKGNQAMRSTMGMIVAMGVLAAGLGLAGCTNRPLSAMDTFFFQNTHPHLVWQGGEVQYQD